MAKMSEYVNLDANANNISTEITTELLKFFQTVSDLLLTVCSSAPKQHLEMCISQSQEADSQPEYVFTDAIHDASSADLKNVFVDKGLDELTAAQQTRMKCTQTMKTAARCIYTLASEKTVFFMLAYEEIIFE